VLVEDGPDAGDRDVETLDGARELVARHLREVIV
jgi:hypothetical protein